MSPLIDESLVPGFQVRSTTPPSSPPTFPPSPTTATRSSPPIDIENLLDIDSVLDEADRFLGGISPSAVVHAVLPKTSKVAIHLQTTPPSSIAASSPTKRRVTFWETPTSQKWSDGVTPQHSPSSKRRRGLIPKPILKQRSPPAVCDPRTKMAEALKTLATANVDNCLAQYNGLQDILRMVDTCPEIDTLFTTSKKELLKFVARDMIVRVETTQVQLNLARNVIEFLPLLVNRLGFEDGAKQECGKILDRSLDYLEIPESSFTERSGKTAKMQKSHGFQLSNLTRLHLQFWTGQTLTNSLTEQHVRRINGVLERHWRKAEEAAKARDEDPTNKVESTYEKASSVQARLRVLQKLLHQVPVLMTKDAKRWLVRLLEETINPRHPEVRKIATDIGITTASEMGCRKEVAQAMLSIMTNASKSKDRNYVQRRVVCLHKRLNGKDIDKDLVPDSWVFPLLYMQHADVRSQAWSQLAAYREVIKDCFKTEILNRKLACWEALRKLISAEFGNGHDKHRLQEIWQWLQNWIPIHFERATEDDFANPLFVSSVYTYLRVLQKALPATHWQPAEETYLDQVWELCVVSVMNKMEQRGNTRAHKTLACRILASLFQKPGTGGFNDIWMEHEEFGPGLKDVQVFNATWARSRLPQILEVMLPLLEYDILSGEGREMNDDLQLPFTRMWAALLQTISNTHNNMGFTSSGRKEFKKVMAHVTNHLTSLWITSVSSPNPDFGISSFFSNLFAAVDALEPSNFAQNHIFSINGGSCDASSPSHKGQKAQSPSLHLSALIVRSLFSKSKLCDNINLQLSLARLWSCCLASRNSLAEQLEYLHSLSECIHSAIQKEGTADHGCKQAKLVFTPILKLATDAFLATSTGTPGPTFNRQPCEHIQRVIEIVFSCTTPNTKQMQDLYSAMVSSIKAETFSLSKAKSTDAAHTAPTGDTAVAIILTGPYTRLVLRLLNDTHSAEPQPTLKFLLEFVTTIVRHDRRPISRAEFKIGRALFETAKERVLARTIEQHYSEFHQTVNKAISMLYSQHGTAPKIDTSRMLADFIDALVDHVIRTPSPRHNITSFVQDGLSVLTRDDRSKFAAKSILAGKIEHLWKLVGDQMATEVSLNKQKWLKEHDVLLAAGISSPLPAVSCWARNFWHTHFDKADLTPASEVANALDRPQIIQPVVSTIPAPREQSDEDGGLGSSDEEHALPEAAARPVRSSAVRTDIKSPMQSTLDAEIPSSPPVRAARQYLSPTKQGARSLFDPQNDPLEHIPSTPILAPGLDEENIPSSPIVSSERRRSLVSHNPRSQTSIKSPHTFGQGTTIPFSSPAAISPHRTHQGAVIQIREDDITGSAVPSFNELHSSAASETSQPSKKGRGRPRKSSSQKASSQMLSKAPTNPFVTAYKWRNLFHKHRPHISSVFQDHDPDGSHRYWMETALDFHKVVATQCDYIEKFFGAAPFDIWTTDCAPSHWSEELINSVAELATAIRNGAAVSEMVTRVRDVRDKRIADSDPVNDRIAAEDVEEVVAELRDAELTPGGSGRKRKRGMEAEMTVSQPRRKRNQSTHFEPQGSQEPTSSRYSTRARSGPSKDTSRIASIKIRPEKTPDKPGWKGWVAYSESPEPEPEDFELLDKKKHTCKRKSELEEVAEMARPSGKRFKLGPPSTPERDGIEIRSDPIVNVTPGDPAGRNVEKGLARKQHGDRNASKDDVEKNTTRGSRAGLEGTQRKKGSPAAWLQRFKDMITDIPMYLWKPRDQQEARETLDQAWEKIEENKPRK
ncbi:hypothetical protein FKW77_005746 [Venturia effusa]|uniref:Telomere-associated protein Rif1 N-terminal domain-containing protein n=1 Tax=Venturia effusa TaxID=50376 RepID=A0A517L9C8_9PEZI|nr:hypothetical protein FKW77_005746 [Venturia effusa]